jgi:hypothetical protein
MFAMERKVHPDWTLIQDLGGPAAVARELHLPAASGVQTVQNWKHRGIPYKTKVDRPDLFMPHLRPKVRAAKVAG